MVGRGDDMPDTRLNLAPLKTHTRERISVQQRPGGTCTPLHSFSRVLAEVFDNTGRQSRVSEYLNRLFFRMPDEDAANTTIGTNFGTGPGVIGALVEYDPENADLFTVNFRVGAECEAPLTLNQSDNDFVLQMVSSGVSLQRTGVGSVRGGVLPACSNSTLSSAFAAIMDPVLAASGLLLHEPQYSLAWTPPGSEFEAAAPTIECPSTISLPSPGKLGYWGSAVAAYGAGEHTLHASFPGQAGGNATSITARDALNVSRITMRGARGVSTGPDGGELTVPADYRGNVTFTAVNLLGLAASCTSLVTTFTTHQAWDPASMDVGGESAGSSPGQPESAATYYAGGPYNIDGPLSTRGSGYAGHTGSTGSPVLGGAKARCSRATPPATREISPSGSP